MLVQDKGKEVRCAAIACRAPEGNILMLTFNKSLDAVLLQAQHKHPLLWSAKRITLQSPERSWNESMLMHSLGSHDKLRVSCRLLHS